MQLSTFIAYVYLSGLPLTASRVYTSIALFNMLIAPLNAFPWVVNGMIDGLVSLRRLDNFFRLTQFRVKPSSDFVNRSQYFCKRNHMQEGNMVGISSGSIFEYPSKEKENFRITLGPLEFSARFGSLILVTGDIGSGKSAFLHSILGEMVREKGNVFVAGADFEGIGYAPQQPWLFSGSVRDNIIFGRSFDSHRYEKVLDKTCLRPDLQQLSNGDHTEVGEDGSALSGGQRQRVALARAVYSGSHKVYLLDDPLASVDNRVGRQIFERCIMGLLVKEQAATVIMATNRSDISQADLVICLKNGVVTNIGRPQDVVDTLEGHSSPISDFSNSSGGNDAESNSSSKTSSDGDGEEKMEAGSVKLSVWNSYVRAAGIGWVLFAFISLLLMQGSRNAADIWLAHWLGDSQVGYLYFYLKWIF